MRLKNGDVLFIWPLALPVSDAPAFLIGPASDGDAMTLWRQAQASSCEYFARYTE